MAYTINYSGGTITVVDGTLDNTSTSLSLPGRNYAGYGSPVDQNQVYLLENFAYFTASPPNPITGQIWYDTTNTVIKYNVSTTATPNWVSVAAIGSNVTFGTITATGDITTTGTITGNILTGTVIVATSNVSTGVQTGIAATGTLQADAYQLTKDISVVTSASAGVADGVKLPVTTGGNRITVMNLDSADTIKVYPNGVAQINSLGSTTPYNLVAGARLDFVSISANQWYTLNSTYA